MNPYSLSDDQTLFIPGDIYGKYNIVQYPFTIPTALSSINPSLCAVQIISPSRYTLRTYRPTDLIPQFTHFLPNSGYIVIAKGDITIYNPIPTPTPTITPTVTETPAETPLPTETPAETPSQTPTPSVTPTPMFFGVNSGKVGTNFRVGG